jgi:hypothetical protein
MKQILVYFQGNSVVSMNLDAASPRTDILRLTIIGSAFLFPIFLDGRVVDIGENIPKCQSKRLFIGIGHPANSFSLMSN